MSVEVGGWETRLDDEMVRHYTDTGRWTGVTLRHCALRCARQFPDRIAIVEGGVQLRFGEVLQQALRLAATMRKRGLKAGDVLSFQLPNWYETLVINVAAAIGGFICNPIVPIYRDAEVGFILRESRTKILFIPEAFRGIEYLSMAERLRPGLPDLKHVVLLRSEKAGQETYSDWLGEDDVSIDSFADVDANAVKLLLYTSGTTGEPKGVLHSHNTLRADIDATAGFWGLTDEDVLLMPSPVTHITGYLYGLELPFALGIRVVMMDRWQAAEAVQLISHHKVSFSVGATPFLTELVSEIEKQALSLPSLRFYASGGAAVPPEIVRRARTVLPNCRTFRAYGCSEAPTVSLGVPLGGPAELGATTDGQICNHDVRIVDPVTGADVPMGENGEILTRGPEVMLGYTKAKYNADAFDPQGYFRTGDLGHVDSNQYITITGRKKDLIIRGGENISPKEIEDVLHGHPAVAEAAVVAMPHPRMGETPCAYVVLRPGTALDFDAMIRFLDEAKLARQKFPERLVVVDDLPRNAAGKVLKHELRTRIAQALLMPA